MRQLTRRQLLLRALAGLSAISLSGCDNLSRSQRFTSVLASAEGLNRRLHHLIALRQALAREYSAADISPVFRANGTTSPFDREYLAHAQSHFAEWRLLVNGLVERPSALSLAELRQLPSRAQITRHDCVEGWSCIGKWKGVPLAMLLERARLQPQARYVVFHCADVMDEKEGAPYYESIDLVDAFHPQTILAYEMNGRPLPVEYGAPARMRVERQLGYKMAKYVMRIEAVESFAALGEGKGGYWEDRGYEWYAGI